MKNLFKKLYICFFFLIFSTSTFGQEGLLDKYFPSTLNKCVKKNIDNILNFKIVPPQELYGLKISFTQELLSRLEKTMGDTIDSKLMKQKTVGMFVNELGIDEEFIKFYKELKTSDEVSDIQREQFETFLDILRQTLKSNSQELRESSENICNQQGVY